MDAGKWVLALSLFKAFIMGIVQRYGLSVELSDDTTQILELTSDHPASREFPWRQIQS
jgi:hypothetical protein